ncbi:MAG: transposase [Curvibacter sp. RIFCSPHIGHO2_12_FULL_63_18]|uniref:REP-associated tyrosine transposase n=1 Tax=Rhodoferax sp. TaxID=50421 RepID=UPI0008D2BE4F|nr:transposase [Rhodoferax sp.]OGO99601.1 MAG: transposase [Curvibacter sp. GWA2_63_95]OGP03619.1 MAG: transposase [Curvibacter sp. RIFCSPHIGHO2_12_FULL_63_18]HCX80856.1 transposase [Rhodoferax sp.]
MARLPRLTLAAHPHHVIQRGNNRQSICLDRTDFQTLKDVLAASAQRHQVAVHAFVLMDNHFHLLATPPTDEALPKMMQTLGRSYVRYFNDRHQRTGTLWEGRYKSTLIESERYLLACMAYIDLNPVRAGLVTNAADYAWSSYAHYAGIRADKLLTPHPLVWSLGNTPFAREAAYAQLVQAGLTSVQQSALTEAALHGWALGESEFLNALQKETPRRLRKSAPGRPPKSTISE